MVKKTTLNELGAMLTHVVEHMTKIDGRIDALVTKLSDQIAGLTVKVTAIQNTLDAEAIARSDQKIPERVTRIEKHLGLDHKVAA